MKLLTTACCLVTLLFIGSSVASAVPIIALKQRDTGLNNSNQLMRFDSTAPEFIQSEPMVSGLLPSETLLAIDFRPANGKLYGVTNLSRLYVINPNTGAATLVSPDTFNPLIPSGTTEIAFDFNPVTDLIRIVTPAGQNLRVNPDTGVVVAVDNTIAFAAGDPNAGRAPSVSAAAYSNNVSGSTSTTLYVITNLNFSGGSSILATQGSPGGAPVSPNTGQLFTVANLSGIFIEPAGLDIFADGTAYALINGTDTFNQFFTVNLSTGALSHFATFGQLFRMRDLAVVLPNSEPPAGTFQFSSSSFSVDEGSNSVTVTITRTGNTGVPATIDLTTVDDSATQTSDYTIALRRIDFGAGETSKNVKILIVDDAFVDPSESFKVVLSNATGGFLPPRANSASVTIVDNDPITVLPLPNPLGDPQFFVRQHYADFLNREPDPVGFDFWVNQITSCGSNQQCVEEKRILVSAAFFLSIEFQKTGFTVYLTHRAAQLGLLAPDALPLYVNYMRDVQALQKDFVFGAPGADGQLEANTQAFFNDVVNREEFVARFGSLPNASYVDVLIFNTGVAFSQAERDALVNGLTNQTETRATVLRKVTDNQAFKQAEFNRAFVLMEYFGYLRRNSDVTGFNFWLAKLNSFNGDFIKADMVKAFISSREYRSRFGTP
jgi:hypothetical protein